MVAVSLRLDLRIEEVLLEGDALSVIKKMNSCNEDGSVIGAYIYDAKLKAKGSKRYLFRHVPKDANKVVHIIAREDLRRGGITYLRGCVSDFARDAVENDRSMKAGLRNNNGFWGCGRLPKTVVT
ncbi:hypothetical protein Goshw_022487 [Gossypium schwendimanii]|uniref:RNase H type-1 domain-containing protein n=1 Tax=Gossypium schwendimanii TaxID=34291 RepID=A0A7J9L598_GOSSC|nr:hypothetical protein [Gossypium schwendimanii]